MRANAIPQDEQIHFYPDGRTDRLGAARYLGLKPKTLAMYASRGIGPPFVSCGRTFYFKKDLDHWLESRRVISTAQARQLRAEREIAGAQSPATVSIPRPQHRKKRGLAAKKLGR